MDALRQDLRYALRRLRRSPGFTAVAVITLALGIGATTAVYSVVHALLLEPLPYPESDRIVYVYQTEGGDEGPGNMSIRNFFDVAERATSFEGLAATGGWFDPSFLSGDLPIRLDGAFGSTDLFRVLGVEPVLGRGFSDEDGQDVVVVSHGFWRTHLGGRTDVLGGTIRLDGEPVTVIGVMPEGFRGPTHLDAELWLHFPTEPRGRRRSRNMAVLGRLAPGVDESRARNELASILAGLRARHPDVLSETGIGIRPLREEMFGDARRPLGVLLCAAALLLLVGCVNVSSLMLARALARRKEIGIRLALGAGRGRIVRHTLTEGLLVAAAGALGGVLLAGVATDSLTGMGPAMLRAREIGMDAGLLVFAAGLLSLATVTVTLLPALRTSRMLSRDGLGERSSSARSRKDTRVRDGLVVAQLAAAVTMLAGAGAFARSLANLHAIDPGFRSDGIVSAEVALPSRDFTDPAGPIAVFEEILGQVRELPGVEDASATSLLPFSGSFFTTGVRVEGRAYAPDDVGELVDRVIASPGYFSTLGIPLLRGRAFGDEDRLGGPAVAVINRHLSRRLFGDSDPVGRRIILSFADSARTVVGVVGDVRMESLNEPSRGQVYIPHAQWGELEMAVVVRSRGEPLELVPAIRRAVASVRPEQPVGTVATMEALVAEARRPVRFMSVLLAVLAGVAIAIAGAGLYAVSAYFVQTRRAEFGIRMALGARATDVVWLVARRGFVLMSTGLTLGLLAGLATTRVLATLLVETGLGDPWVLAGVTLLLAVVTLLANAFPAAAAARVEPRDVLAAE